MQPASFLDVDLESRFVFLERLENVSQSGCGASKCRPPYSAHRTNRRGPAISCSGAGVSASRWVSSRLSAPFLARRSFAVPYGHLIGSFETRGSRRIRDFVTAVRDTTNTSSQRARRRASTWLVTESVRYRRRAKDERDRDVRLFASVSATTRGHTAKLALFEHSCIRVAH